MTCIPHDTRHHQLTSDLLWSCGIHALKFMPKVPVTPDTVAKHSIAQLTTRFSDTISLRLRSTRWAWSVNAAPATGKLAATG